MSAVCEGCGSPLTGKQTRYCSARCKSRVNRRDDDYRARDRAASRAWKAAHPAAVAFLEETYRGICGDCGDSTTRYRDLCQSCQRQRQRAEAHERHSEIARRWNAGETLRGIAAALDSTENSIGTTIVRMRAAGWDVPYRYRAYAEREAA